jgi:hypothetical protein
VFDKTSESMFGELNAAILPNGHIELEGSPAANQIGRDQKLLQDGLWKRIRENYESFLLFLGLSRSVGGHRRGYLGTVWIDS